MRNNKDQKENYKKIIIVLLVLVLILLCINKLLSVLYDNANQPEKTHDELSSIRDVIVYYESIYLREYESKNRGYDLDVEVTFKYKLYNDDDTSNEKFYNNLIEDCAKVINYKSFVLIDNKNEIIIKVSCKDGNIDKILINDIEDYFIYMDSQISLGKFKEIPSTNLEITSGLINYCIENEWREDLDFGSKESIFKGYDIYFDEGYNIRTIDKRVYNIVFTKNYKENVIGNIFPGMTIDEVKVALGKPAFEDKELKVVGYKSDRIYAFFNEEEISIYRIPDVSTDDFFDLADDFLKEKIDFLEFMNDLTYLWPDYSDYDYTSTSVYISYPLKGVEICLNTDDTDGFLVYNNIRSSMSKVGRYLENTDFVSRLQVDLVFKKEKDRIQEDRELYKNAQEYEKNLPEDKREIVNDSMNYYCYPVYDSYGFIKTMYLIAKDKDVPNRELRDGMTSYTWINNDYLAYAKQGIAILIYNLRTGEVARLINGSDPYEIKGCSDGTLYYDETSIYLY